MKLYGFVRKLIGKFILWPWATVVFLIISAVVLFFTGYFNLTGIAWLTELCNGSWKAILSGGFIAVILKSFQFLNIFKEEIQGIVYGEDFLKNTTTEFKEKAWRTVTKSLYESSFPKISTTVEDIIYARFIPKRLDNYREGWEVYYDVDAADANHIRLVETQKFTIKSHTKKAVLQSFDKVIGLNSPDDKSDLQLLKLEINGKDYLSKIGKPSKTVKGEYVELAWEFNLDLNDGMREYDVEKILSTVHTRKMNVWWQRSVDRYTDSLQIGINARDIEFDFIHFRNEADFKPVAAPVAKFLRKCEGLILPEEEYIIFMK